ncbi:FecR domain-containing protein [Sphingomonas sp. G-3-2-10]|uniref:FecR family protein n=1 Tax=Sphingomonas sp. G-3-2-10 TaxID=2728838 RepID=UPI00146C75A3|nr:FecR domain-containing protein [Sphingomonas sp. G-3-2-10]NML04300.1 FecR domain-containing protein [Sphingomonas sp. G-3-2-10]
MRIGLALATSAAAIAIVAAAAPVAEQIVGAATAVKNDVRIRKPAGGVARPVALRQRIALGDGVQTGAKSQLQIVLLDRSVFTVGANARVTIDRFVYDPGRPSSVGATVTRGAFRFMSGRGGSNGSSIRTPVASIGVRGTILEGVVGPDAALIAAGERAVGRIASDPETASLIVRRGPGRATQGGARPGAIDVSAGGRTVTADRPLQAIYVPRAGAAPIGPFPISNAGLMQLQAILHPSVAARLGILGPEDNAATATGEPGLTWPVPSQPARPPRLRPPGGGFDDDAPPAYRGPGNIPDLPSVEPRRPPSQPQSPNQPQNQAPSSLRAAPAPSDAPARAPTSAGKPVATDMQQPQSAPPAPNDSVKAPPQQPGPTPTPTPAKGYKPPK